METTVHEIADGIYRFSTYVPQIAPPDGFTFNQFLVKGDEALLFHCGQRQLFPSVSTALARVMPLTQLRWIGFGHLEADECGAMNDWLVAAPRAQVAFGQLGCLISINDFANRPPRPLAENDVLDLGGKRLRYLPTPHVPHNWEAGLFHEEQTATLLCGDLFTHLGNGPAVTESDLLGPAIAAEQMFQASALTPQTAPTIRRLAGLQPKTLALMHGSSFSGDGAIALGDLAAFYQDRLNSQMRQ